MRRQFASCGVMFGKLRKSKVIRYMTYLLGSTACDTDYMKTQVLSVGFLQNRGSRLDLMMNKRDLIVCGKNRF
jgi:hypothetical protein